MTEDAEDAPTLDMSEGVPIKDVPMLSYVLYNMAAVKVDNAKRYQEAMKAKESAATKALQLELERRETERLLEVERRETAIQIEKAKMETEMKRMEAEDKAQETIKMRMEFLKTPGGTAMMGNGMMNAMGNGMTAGAAGGMGNFAGGFMHPGFMQGMMPMIGFGGFGNAGATDGNATH